MIPVLHYESFNSDQFCAVAQNFFHLKMIRFLIIFLAFVCVFDGIVAFSLENVEKSGENGFFR